MRLLLVCLLLTTGVPSALTEPFLLLLDGTPLFLDVGVDSVETPGNVGIMNVGGGEHKLVCRNSRMSSCKR